MKELVLMKKTVLSLVLALILSGAANAEMICDFESYTSDAQLQADWQTPYYAGNGTFTITLDSTNGIDGSKALKYYYVVGSTTDMQHLWTTAMGTANWANYDKVRFWYRPVGCNVGRKWQAYLNSVTGGIASVVTIENFTTQSNEWHVMEFDLNQNGKSHDINYFIGYFYGLTQGDSGTIYFDNFELIKDQIRETNGSTDVMSKGVGSDSYTVNLEKQPATTVTVTATPADASIDIGSGPGVSKSLAFTTENWDVPQTVTVKTANDVDVTAMTTVVISHTASNGEFLKSINVNIWSLQVLVDDFEDYVSWADLGNWPSGGAWGDGVGFVQDLDTTTAHSGTNSMMYTLSGTNGTVIGYLMSAFPAVDCRMYDYARLWYRGDPGNVAGTEMHFILRDASSYDNLGDVAGTDLQSAVWQPVTIKFDKSDKWKKINQVLMSLGPNAGTVWYDDFAFYKSPVYVIESNDVTEVTEGSSTTYKVRLLNAPTANVTVTALTDGLTMVDAGSGAGQSAQLVFTPANYSTEQTITVSAIDDSVLNLGQHSLITHTIASSDTSYAECIAADVNVVIHDNECGAWGYGQGDLNKDCRVNLNDLALVGANWLGTVTETSLQNFESYNSSTFASSWTSFFNASSPSILELLTDPADAKNGQQACRWYYDLSNDGTDGMAEILYQLDTPVDLSQYDQVRVWVKRHVDNSHEGLFYIKFLNNGSLVANIAGEKVLYNADGSTWSNPGMWTEWVIDLHNLTYLDATKANGYDSLDDITSMTHVLFGIWSSTTLGDMGLGMIDFDDIRFGKLLPSDIDQSGKVDFGDMSKIAEKWLTCTNPYVSGCENLF